MALEILFIDQFYILVTKQRAQAGHTLYEIVMLHASFFRATHFVI